MDDAGLRPTLAASALQVRRARPDEIGRCAELYVKVLRETFTWQPPDRHRQEDFFRAAHDEEIYVAVVDGAILGLAALYRPQSFLHSLYVDVRGLGVGAALLAYVAAQADGPLSLKVQEPNARARAFYARQGFICVEHGRDDDSDVAWLRLVREV